jgi:hypothetical protein
VWSRGLGVTPICSVLCSFCGWNDNDVLYVLALILCCSAWLYFTVILVVMTGMEDWLSRVVDYDAVQFHIGYSCEELPGYSECSVLAE